MEAKMSLCSSEVTNITQKQVAVETIETAAETQMFVESVLQRRPKSPPPVDDNLQPKVEIQTEPLASKTDSESTSSNVRSSSNVPRVVTRVCVCTNSCCNAKSGELCETCPMRDLKRPKDYHKPKLRPVENAVPQRYGSPIITGVSVTINNPGKIREAVKDLFTQIPDKKTTTSLGSALATAPKEPFTPISSTNPTQSVSLPKETKPYLPPERPILKETKPQPPAKPKPMVPDTPFIAALRIAPDRPFTPVDMPAPVKKKKPKEDPILKDLPKPVQWMSMVSALTTAPDRPYSPFVTETSSTIKQAIETEVRVEEINKMKETQQEIMKRSVHNATTLPKPFTAPKRLDKFEAMNDDKVTPRMNFPPISNELKCQYEYEADYREVKREISAQIVEQAHLDEKTLCKKECQKKECRSDVQEVGCVKKIVSECHKVCSKTKEQMQKEKLVEKQSEETVMKKPLELSGYLQKAEYLPQYQLSLNYDETIQLPHHKDIKKLLPIDQSKFERKEVSVSNTRELLKQKSSQLSSSTTKQAKTKPIVVTEGTKLNVPQVVFQPVVEDRPPRMSFSPRPGSITPSMINKPAPVIPYYQESLVATQLPAPEINIFDPKSPDISRSPSPCPDRAPSPFGRLSPRPVSPAAGPPPNPLRKGESFRKFVKEDYKVQEAKKNISEYIPQYREKVDGIVFVRDIEKPKPEVMSRRETQNATITAPSIGKYVQNANNPSCSFQSAKQKSISQSTVIASTKEQSFSTKSASGEQTFTSTGSEKSTSEKKQASNSSSEYPFQKVKNPEIIEPGVIGMHLTNPQQITSPFISQQETQSQTELPKVPQPTSKKESQSKCQITTTASNAVKPNAKRSDPGVSASIPTVSQPNTGSGGGRQAGAIGVTPKRGRGVLNVGGLAGARIPMCGHCHGHISNTAAHVQINIQPTINGKQETEISTDLLNQDVSFSAPSLYSPVFARKNSPMMGKTQANFQSNDQEDSQNREKELKAPSVLSIAEGFGEKCNISQVSKLKPIISKVPPITESQNNNNNNAEIKNFQAGLQDTGDNYSSLDLNHSSQITLTSSEGNAFGPISLNFKIPKDARINNAILSETDDKNVSVGENNVGANTTKIDENMECKEVTPQDSDNHSKSVKLTTTSMIKQRDLKTNTMNNTNDIPVNNNKEIICCVCNTEIQRGPFITALGKIWCPEHFTCNTPTCKRPLHDLGFVEEQGKLYCEYCFEQYIAPPCSKCGAKVKGDCLKAIGKNFHPECFSCAYCGKLFGNSPFFLEDAQPYCETDWNELFTTKCFACGFPVEAGDRWVEALNNNYHSQCFNCTMCKKNLEGQSFFAKGGRPFCKNHAR